MSFKIFSFQLTGKIKPTSAIEKKRAELAADFAEFQKTEASDELKVFLELEKWANSDAFKKSKSEIESLSFKGSKEENQLKEYQKLKKSGPIKKYFSVEGSSDLKRFEKERDSEKMKSYYALLDYVKEGQFDQDKKEIKSQVFKGSVEEKHWLEFRKLEKSAGIRAYKELHASDAVKKHEALEKTEKFKKYQQLKNASGHNKEEKAEFKKLKSDREIKAYFRFERSKKLKLYREMLGSHDLKRFDELKQYVNGAEFKKREAFLKDKKKFEKSEAFKKYSEFKKLSGDDSVKFVLKYEKSALYKNYLDVKDSFDLKRYHELEEIINSDEFKKQKAWLEDKKRWEKTEEYKKYQQYLKEKERPEFVKYFKYKKSDDFDFLKNWEVVFEDSFSSSKLDDKKWSVCTATAGKMLGENYALPGDLNIFTQGKNVSTSKNLRIQVKKEKAQGKVWKMPAGFVPTVFEYTSGLVSSDKAFEMKDGVVEAKIKFDPLKSVISSMYLASEETNNRVNLLEMGARNNLGFSIVNGKGKVESQGLDISNLKKGDYIFTLEKQGQKFTWKINEKEIITQENRDLDKSLHIVASSLVIDEISGAQLPASFDVEWVKCYAKK